MTEPRDYTLDGTEECSPTRLVEAYKAYSHPTNKKYFKKVLDGKGETLDLPIRVELFVDLLSDFPKLSFSSLLGAFHFSEIDAATHSLALLTKGRLREKAEHQGSKPNKSSSKSLLEVTEGTEDPEIPSDSYPILGARYNEFYSFSKRKPTTLYNAKDDSLARMAVALFAKEKVLLVQETLNWYVWNRYKWETANIGAVRRLLSEMGDVINQDITNIRKMPLKEAHVVIKTRHNKTDPDDIQKAYEFEMATMHQMVDKLHSKSGQDHVAALIGDRVTQKALSLDTNTDEVVFTNKSWNAQSNAFTTPKPSSLNTKSIDLPWSEPTEQARKNWQSYLNALGFSPETLTFLQRSFGYTMLGRGSAKRFWWFRGESNTGKTTLIEIVANCMGSYRKVTDPMMWLHKTGNFSGGHNDDVAALSGCRMVTADEFPQNSRFDASMLKRATAGGGKITASRKGEKGTDFAILFGLYCSSNFDPYIDEGDEAALNRLTSLTFKAVVPPEDRVEQFPKKFVEYGDNAMAVLEWCMKGARDYIYDGFGPEPEEVTKSREEYKADQLSLGDQLAVFIEPETNRKLSVSAADIRSALTTYQNRTKQTIKYSNKQLSSLLKDRFGAESCKSHGVTMYKGIKIATKSIPATYDDIDLGFDDARWGEHIDDRTN